jgi:hypothetical protein
MNKFNYIGICLVISFIILSISSYKAVVYTKNCDRTVTVKGLAEIECMADKVIWPIKFIVIDNELPPIFNVIEQQSKIITNFLLSRGIKDNEITFSSLDLKDKEATEYSNYENVRFRYYASKTITVCSNQVEIVKQAIADLGTLGKHGIIFDQNYCRFPIEYQFTALNDLKPKMIEQATAHARSVAEKFAQDSQSHLGKIKHASQGNFSIVNRDANTPYIKKIRVVSTITYYISN